MLGASKPDGVSGSQSEPLGNGTVLSHLLCEDSLSTERLLRRLRNVSIPHHASNSSSYHSILSIAKQSGRENRLRFWRSPNLEIPLGADGPEIKGSGFGFITKTRLREETTIRNSVQHT